MDQVKEIYESHGYPAAQRLWALVKAKNIEGVKLKDVQDFVASQETAQVHRRPVKHVDRPITASNPLMDLQMDLLDYSKHGRYNDGYNWILLVIDIFDRKVAAVPLKNKSAATTLEGIKEVFEELGTPWKLTSDSGSEFKGAVDKFLAEKEIAHHVTEPQDHNVLGMVDRMSSTIKSMISKHMFHRQTNRWVDVLPDLVKHYNNTPHSALEGMAPNEAHVNVTETRDIAYERVLESEKKAKPLKVGDYVRVFKRKGVFGKGYETRWSVKVYQIVKVDGVNYELDDGKIVRGHQLQKVSKPEVPDAEKEVEERKEESVAPTEPVSSLAPGRHRPPTPEPELPKGTHDVVARARHEHQTGQILKHKEGISQSNRRSGLRERSLSSMLRHPLYGDVRW